MLVKLGDIWVDPCRVSSLGTMDGTNKVMIVVDGRNCFPNNISVEDCADIINKAGQSYGGGEDETPKKD